MNQKKMPTFFLPFQRYSDIYSMGYSVCLQKDIIGVGGRNGDPNIRGRSTDSKTSAIYRQSVHRSTTSDLNIRTCRRAIQNEVPQSRQHLKVQEVPIHESVIQRYRE
ncbi:uncharacterized protein LOC116844953 [Odontomachus brunneus]|uniref:uncharacterized protein LOC116844953 n=1 Tax=Odontomachus brunneus TaxID=486640 RepID=UPI0013F22D9A|nr:uncharacterized protein LOC116844953 [Odontomachus brunneus]